jgi:hypothetical protein
VVTVAAVPSARTIAAGGAAAALLAAPTVIAFSAGGFFEGARMRAGIVVWVAVAVAALAGRPLVPRTRATRLCMLGLFGFAVWTTAAVAWSPLRDPGLGDAERVWLYAGYLLLAAAFLRGRVVRLVEPAIAGGMAVVAAYALATRLLPSVVPAKRSFSAGARLDQPLTYWNGLGLLMAMTIVLLVRIASDPSRPGRVRTAAAALTPIPGLALYLTFSRGSIAALAAGVVVLLVVCRDRRTLATALVCLGCGGLAAAAASRFPAIDSLSGSASSQRNEGAAVLAITLATCALAAGGQLAVARGVFDRLRLRGAPALATVLLVVALAVGGALALTRSPAPPPAGPAPKAGAGAQLPTNRARLGTLKTNRYDYWRVALHGFADNPIAGVGTHGFQQLWVERRDINEYAQDAHSLYIETAAELGLIGLALLGVFLLSGGAVVARLMRQAGGRALMAGTVAASAVWLVHAGIDWDWEMPAVTLPLLALLGAALGEADERSIERDGGEHDQRRLGRDAESRDAVDEQRDDADHDDERQERPERSVPASEQHSAGDGE